LYLHPSATARAPVALDYPSDRFLYFASQEVFEGDASHRVLEERGVEAVLVRANPEQRWRGERVALHLVYIEGEAVELERAPEVFVGSVALAVYAVERGFEVFQESCFLAVGFSSMGNVQNLYNTPLILYPVDNAVVADSYSPVFSTLEFSAARRLGFFDEAAYRADHPLVDRVRKPGYVLLYFPL
jgi:hypothetical protein